ncbi:hypothetical protein TUM12370_34310 [Salmonella enterica subsp. enterica serovar Choleraesuis]|nr:hypothetical protein TUM12370_34310 [Salmonella enterica subsp. enterica serovar Choleraesuis]
MKEQFTKSVRVSGKGDTKAKAFADALSHVQGEVLKTSQHILLRIEPQDVKVVTAEVATRKEAFLFFFLKRSRHTYRITLDVTVNIAAINIENVTFNDV